MFVFLFKHIVINIEKGTLLIFSYGWGRGSEWRGADNIYQLVGYGLILGGMSIIMEGGVCWGILFSGGMLV